MRLRRIQIEGFRAISRLDLAFDELTVLIGQHASGKSSVIEVIERCLAPRDPGNPQPTLVRTDFRQDPTSGSRASSLAVTTEIVAGGRRDGLPGSLGSLFRPVGNDPEPAIRLRLRGDLHDDGAITSDFAFLESDGSAIEMDDTAARVEQLRSLMPALVVRGGKGLLDPPSFEGEARDDPRHRRFRGLYARLVHQHWTLTPDEIRDFFTEAVDLIGSRLKLRSSDQRPVRTAADLVATAPGAIRTTLDDAIRLASEGDMHRALVLCTLFCATISAVDAVALNPDATPIFVFDDIEAHLHPMWIARLAGPLLSLDGQKIVSTHSPEVIAWSPLGSIRRLGVTPEGVAVWQVRAKDLSVRQQRKISYHVRGVRSNAFFSRCWLLVEGESEAWLLPEFAALMGVEFASEGIRCIEFAQCGLNAMIKLARSLGIEWYLLADGDQAGRSYADTALQYVEAGDRDERITVLEEDDIEHCLFYGGYADVYAEVARKKGRGGRRDPDERVISRALLGTSKPDMAIAVLEEAQRRGADGVPDALRRVIERVVAVGKRGQTPLPGEGV